MEIIELLKWVGYVAYMLCFFALVAWGLYAFCSAGNNDNDNNDNDARNGDESSAGADAKQITDMTTDKTSVAVHEYHDGRHDPVIIVKGNLVGLFVNKWCASMLTGIPLADLRHILLDGKYGDANDRLAMVNAKNDTDFDAVFWPLFGAPTAATFNEIFIMDDPPLDAHDPIPMHDADDIDPVVLRVGKPGSDAGYLHVKFRSQEALDEYLKARKAKDAKDAKLPIKVMAEGRAAVKVFAEENAMAIWPENKKEPKA